MARNYARKQRKTARKRPSPGRKRRTPQRRYMRYVADAGVFGLTILIGFAALFAYIA